MLHPGWDSDPLRHHSHRLVLQTEGKTNSMNVLQKYNSDKNRIIYNILRVLFKDSVYFE